MRPPTESPENIVSNYEGLRPSKQGYNPNHISPGLRIICVIVSSILLIYGIFSIKYDDLYLPGKRTKGLHLHGEPMWIMIAAFGCAVLNLLSIVVDHYDKRNNEINYKRFARITSVLGWVLFGLAVVLDIFVFKKSTR